MAQEPTSHSTLFDHLEAYWRVLGRLIDRFAAVEKALFLQLVIELGVPLPEAKAIIAEARIDKLKEQILRLRTAKALPPSPFLERAFEQLGHLTRFRNDLVHYGVNHTVQNDGTGERWVLSVSNDLWASSPAKVRTYAITLDTLLFAIHDLEIVQACFAVHTLTGIAPPEFIAGGFGPAAQTPWRYKPPAPSAPRGSSHSPGQEPQPGASPASPKRKKLSSAQKRAERAKMEQAAEDQGEQPS